jgi:pimeloyl-ACP methyl ester carboxylesterase
MHSFSAKRPFAHGTGGAPLFFQQAGQGSPLLLLHGLEVNGTMFDPIVPALTAHHQVIVPDLRGHGHSQDLPDPYDVAQHAADVKGLLDTLALSTVDVLGYSHGGAVAQCLAYTFPHRVRRLILACTYACKALSFREKIDDRLRPWLIGLFGSHRLIHFVIRTGALGPLNAEQTHRLLAMVPRTGTQQMIARTRGLTTFDSRPWLAQIRASTLIIAGNNDPVVPLAHAQMLLHGIAGARLEIIANAGHMLIWTHTDQFIALIKGFLEPRP